MSKQETTLQEAYVNLFKSSSMLIFVRIAGERVVEDIIVKNWWQWRDFSHSLAIFW